MVYFDSFHMFFSSQNITPALPALAPVAPVGPGYNVAISACAGRAFDVAHGLFQEMFGARMRIRGEENSWRLGYYLSKLLSWILIYIVTYCIYRSDIYIYVYICRLSYVFFCFNMVLITYFLFI